MKHPYEGEKRKNGEEKKREEKKREEDRIVNGYQLDSGQPWYAALGNNVDPKYVFYDIFFYTICKYKLMH